MRNSRKRGTLPRAEPQKRLNRDGPNLSRFDACGALARPACACLTRCLGKAEVQLAAIAGCASWATTHWSPTSVCHVERGLGPAVPTDARSVNIAMDCPRQPTIKAPRSTIKFAQVRAYL